MRLATMTEFRLATLALATLLAAGVATASQAQEALVVVELFTSQGCSSYPPADAFLTDLVRERRDVLPLAFNVSYWDQLGWKDPYAMDAATTRQKAYARQFRDDGIYTPQMVVDGSTGFVGSDRSAGLNAIKDAGRKTVPVTISRDGPSLLMKVGRGGGPGISEAPSAARGAGTAQIVLVGFDPSHITPIGRGKNSGRTLLETNIVRSLTPVGSWSGSAVDLREPPPAG
jgi:hypothetical protein